MASPKTSMNEWHARLASPVRYLLSITFFFVALGLRFVLLPSDAGLVFITFYPMLIVVFYLCGRGPGLLFGLLSCVAGITFFFAPHQHGSIGYNQIVATVLFMLNVGLIGLLVGKTQKDMTEQKAIRELLQQQTEQQNAMLDNPLVAIAKLRDRHILWNNRAFANLFGYSTNELNGMGVDILYMVESDYKLIGKNAYPILNENGVFRSQLEMRKKDGSSIWLDISGSLLGDSKQESLWMMVDISEMKRQHDQVELIAYHDTLTGLPNRRLIMDRLTQALAQAKRNGKLLALCYLDLDNFKPVNDSFGHEAGDRLLIEIARRLEGSLRIIDSVGRLGGDEFVLLLSGLERPDEYQPVVARVLASINQPFRIDNEHTVNVGASIGIAFYPADGDNPDVLFRHADQAMYRVKQSGRNRAGLYRPAVDGAAT